jgi:hypothetical protein
MATPVYLVCVRVDVGRMSAIISSRCEACSASLAAWLRMNGLATNFVETSRPAEPSSDEGTEYATGLLDAFRRWFAAAAQREAPNHLEVPRYGP